MMISLLAARMMMIDMNGPDIEAVDEVPAVDNIKTLKGRFIAHKFSTGWAGDVVESGKEEECCWPVCSQVYARNILLD